MSTRLPVAPPWRRAAAELIFLIGLGLVMGVIGPYGTSAMPTTLRMVYWLLCILGGGLIGVAVDEALGRSIARPWRRVALTSVVMSLPVAFLVTGVSMLLAPRDSQPPRSLGFLGQVFVISALVMTLRALTWRSPRTVVETRTIVAPPLPEAEAAFRRRLSSRRRNARLIAVQAEDHYLRVHTDAGEEMLTMRFADALKALSGVHGFQTHRSWWVAADSIEHLRWRRGVGEARLIGGLLAPVSRSHASTLRAAGWF
ncbi:MAG TPA: LytTR family DNA-binding domain-containing protein [Caulobacteraceae bacterium]